MGLSHLWPLAVPAIAGTAYFAYWWETGYRLSPDGQYYLRAARGEKVPAPYHYRALFAQLLGTDEVVWNVVSAGALTTFVSVVAWQTAHPIVAVLLLVGLPGLFRINVILPILVDPFALMAAALLAAALQHHLPATAMLFFVFAALAKESAPLFGALWAHNPAYIIGALFYLGLCHWGRGYAAAPDQPWLAHPVREARKVPLLNWQTSLLPWGALLPMAIYYGLGSWDWLILGVAYSQLLVAQDRARLYQWAAPALVMIVAAHPATPWLGVLLAVHLLNPYRGT